MHPPDPNERLTHLRARCAEAGIPLTVQRRAVLEALVAREDHPTVDQIHTAVVERLPDVSRATVYRSLETLSELGLLRRVDHPGSSVRFDGNIAPHHHFLCTRCGGMSDLPLEAVRGHEALRFAAPPAVAEEVSILVRGICARCSSR